MRHFIYLHPREQLFEQIRGQYNRKTAVEMSINGADDLLHVLSEFCGPHTVDPTFNEPLHYSPPFVSVQMHTPY